MNSRENAVASVGGKLLHQFPKDLFIPPYALEVLLETFTGPLDLLLYLIRKQNMDILDIPIALITEQYMQYIYLLEKEQFELAADYLVMAALLAEIKSRMLLPKSLSALEEEETDPRLLLVKKLQLYEQFKQAALHLDAMPRYERDFYSCQIAAGGKEALIVHPEVNLDMLMEAMLAVINNQTLAVSHQIIREPLSVQARMAYLLEKISLVPIELSHLLKSTEQRKGLIITFLAILELARQSLITISQMNFGAPIYLTKVKHE